jgi:hypothetical protein
MYCTMGTCKKFGTFGAQSPYLQSFREPRFGSRESIPPSYVACVGNLSPAMGARNQVGTGLSYRPASLCSLATQFQTWFLESIPRPIAGLKFPTLAGRHFK